MYDELTAVLDEARLTIHRTIVAVERLHEGTGVTVPMRAVLEFLRRHGDHTVAAIARARSVSRQHIQVIVNDLLALDLVCRVENPNHRRAHLIRLTEAGEGLIDDLQAGEREAFEPLLTDRRRLSAERLAIAGEVLRQIGAGFEEFNSQEMS